MKTLYLDCSMGAAGDMLSAALLECCPDKEAMLAKINALGIDGVVVRADEMSKCGISGTHISVLIDGKEEADEEHAHKNHEHHHEDNSHSHEHHHEDNSHSHEHHHEDNSHSHEHHHEDSSHSHEHHGHEHSHSSMHEISHIVERFPVSNKVKQDVMEVYQLIAEAESIAHNRPITEIHFHEVGTKDAIIDVTFVCLLMEQLAPEYVVASPVHVGAGTVKCAHGILPVPAPATATILKGVPIYGGSIQSELCTPTGAALLKHFVNEFKEMPMMQVETIGYGMGKKDFAQANCVRAMIGEMDQKNEQIIELACNVDDMTPEQIGFVMNLLFDEGAREVYTIPIGMKKSRTGILLQVICMEQDREKMIELLFKHTTTLGVRENKSDRYRLNREIQMVETSFGAVRKKISTGYGVVREKYEFDDLARIAKEQHMSLMEIRKILETEENN